MTRRKFEYSSKMNKKEKLHLAQKLIEDVLERM